MNEYFISHFETEAPECDAPALWEKKPVGDPHIPKDAGDRDYSGLLDE